MLFFRTMDTLKWIFNGRSNRTGASAPLANESIRNKIMIIQVLSVNDIRKEIMDHYSNAYSWEAAGIIAQHFDDMCDDCMEIPVELDVVALQMDYREYDSLDEYNYPRYKDSQVESWDDVESVVGLIGDGAVIYIDYV